MAQGSQILRGIDWDTYKSLRRFREDSLWSAEASNSRDRTSCQFTSSCAIAARLFETQPHRPSDCASRKENICAH
eukprot:1039615-Rhodomonas_salina.1